jgi:hypothetical protein
MGKGLRFGGNLADYIMFSVSAAFHGKSENLSTDHADFADCKKREFEIRLLSLFLLKNFHAKAQSAQRKTKKLGGLCGFAREKAQYLTRAFSHELTLKTKSV